MRRVSRDFVVAVGTVLVAAVIYRAVVPHDLDGPARQRANLAIAEEELPRVRAALDADPRFREVQAFAYTGQDGGVGLSGAVGTDDDLFRLLKAVAGLQLRVPAAWHVKVLPPPL